MHINAGHYSSKLSVFFAMMALLFSTACKQKILDSPPQSHLAREIVAKTGALRNNGQTKAALRYIDSAYRAFPNPNPLDLWGKYRCLADFYINAEVDISKASLYVDSMFQVIKGHEIAYKAEFTNTFFVRGEVLMAQKRFTEAFKSDYDGREFALKNLDVCGFYVFTQQLGLIKFKQEQYLRAIPYFKQAINENKACAGKRSTTDLLYFPQGVLNTIALSYEKAGKLDSAVYYYKEVLAFLNKSKLTFPDKQGFIEVAEGVVDGNLGGVYARLKNNTEAENYLKESIRLNDWPNRDRNDAKTAKVKLAALYITNNRIDEANELLNQLQNSIDNETNTAGNKNIRISLYKLKWNLFDKTNQTAQAYNYLVKYKALSDSINEVTNGLKNVDMDVAFAANQQQNKVALLSRSNDVKNAYLIAIAIFCLMALGILLTVWFNFKRYRKVVKQVTEQNVQMQAALSALEQSQADNTRMMKVVAHDLRNPIGGITSLAALMLDDDDRSEDDRTMLELIKTSGQDSLDMVSDLLQVNSKSDELKKESVDISNMLHYCAEQLKHKAQAKGQHIELQTEHAIVPVNREKLWRVISNLVGNAIKFSPSGESILLKLTEYPGKAVISVKDHGIGIPDNMKEKIFDMFPEAQRAGTGGEQSFGLGLAISKQIVEAHEGKLWFESIPGKGTTFFVELPTAGTGIKPNKLVETDKN